MDQLVTKTIADIYLRQGHFQKAYEIFKTLSEKDPSDKEIQKKLRAVSEKLRNSSSMREPLRSVEEKIGILKRWLENIQDRRKG